MTEELKLILQAFGVGSIGLIAMWLYHKAMTAIFASVVDIIKVVLTLITTQQQQQDKLYALAEDKQLVNSVLIKLMEVLAKHGRADTEGWENLRIAARVAAGEAADPKAPQ